MSSCFSRPRKRDAGALVADADADRAILVVDAHGDHRTLEARIGHAGHRQQQLARTGNAGSSIDVENAPPQRRAASLETVTSPLPMSPAPTFQRRFTMTIQVGDRIPDVPLTHRHARRAEPTTSGEYFAGKRVALFAVPGAYTPTCSARHLPSYVEKAAELKAKGVDEIACTRVNDAFVMGAWNQATGSAGHHHARRRQWRVRRGASGLTMDASQVRHGQAQPALFDGRQRRRRRAAQCRGAGRISGIQRRDICSTALSHSHGQFSVTLRRSTRNGAAPSALITRAGRVPTRSDMMPNNKRASDGKFASKGMTGRIRDNPWTSCRHRGRRRRHRRVPVVQAQPDQRQCRHRHGPAERDQGRAHGRRHATDVRRRKSPKRR